MNKREDYPLIDYFRIIAAFLVVAIHTSPLLLLGDTADFVLTRIIARVAVPFFFMTSGFFLIDEYSANAKKLCKFIKQSAIIYFAAIVLYLPVNIYNGYFKQDNLLPNIIKDIVFDGSFYHLWYLAAAITGALLSWLLVKKLGLKWAFAIAFALYILGLFGDSYYGIAQNIPVLKGLYDNLFQMSEYTRNGIFFAPLFFVLSGIIKSSKKVLLYKCNIIGLLASFCLLICEGMLLHYNKIQRHDSMYFMLIPCMYFLFVCLTSFKGKRSVKLKHLSLIIYIIHPLMIILVRGVAKITALQWLLIDNSLVHFLAVAAASAAAAFSIVQLMARYKPIVQHGTLNTERAWLSINLENLKHNVHALQAAMPKQCKLMAVVKANAYGHGSVEISRALNSTGVSAFAVATIDEGITLRQAGVKGEILILGYTSPARAQELRKYDLMQTLIDYDYSLLLNKQGINVKAHIKIDTGMHRLGFDPQDTPKIEKMFSAAHLQICGIYTHLGSSQSLAKVDVEFTLNQISMFYKLLDALADKGIKLPATHIQSSYGLLNYSGLECDYARIGIALYGAIDKDKTKLKLDLRPVLSLHAKIVLIRSLAKGDTAGYNRKFVATQHCKLAMLPIGYADGLPRSVSCGAAYVLINGLPAPIVGQICMDQLMVDITNIPNVKTGDIATIIGKDNENEILATQLAHNADSIANELLSRMGDRLKIIY